MIYLIEIPVSGREKAKVVIFHPVRKYNHVEYANVTNIRRKILDFLFM